MKSGRNDPSTCGNGQNYKKCNLERQDTDYEKLYFNQLALLKYPELENCQNIIRIGEQIITADRKFEFSTGACVNMARAYLFLWYQTKNKEYITLAKEICDKALEYKSENQQALLVLYEINMCDLNFIAAKKVLSSIIPPLLIQGQAQILMTYQEAINSVNIGEHDPKLKQDLSKFTDTLFEVYKDNPAVYGIATSYYLGLGDDLLRAYEVAKRCIEGWPNAETYCSLGLICIFPQINRVKESIEFLKKGLEICQVNNLEYGLKSNLLTSLLKDKNWDEAMKLANEIIPVAPSNMNYHNYAELLKHAGRYEDAIDWCRKALFLVEDDCSLLTLADIYKRAGKYEDAVETYLRCFSAQDINTNCMSFVDVNGNDIYSIASNTSIDSIKLEAFKGIIHSYVQLKEYENAHAYLSLAKEYFVDQSELEIWEDVIPKLDDFSRAYADAKSTLDEMTNKYTTQKQYFKQWASQLIQLQNNSKNYNLENVNDWAFFEAQMDLILEEMKKSIINHSSAYSRIEAQVFSQYPNIDIDSKKFLVTANLLYDIHQNTIIDFAPIIVEYSKVVEKRLRILLRGKISTSIKMLGEIIQEIDNQTISPYINYLNDFRAVNRLRKKGAHTGLLTKVDADSIRSILFSNDLLAKLC